MLRAIALALLAGCSIQRYAVDKVGDALARSGGVFASDDDLELVRDAAPFSLKLVECLLQEGPRHRGLLLSAARGFAQYAYAFVQQDADRIAGEDVARATELRARARKLYLRARDYGLRGLEVEHPGFAAALRADRRKALSATTKRDVPFLYWITVAWAGAINASKNDPETVADLPIVEAVVDRALALDEGFDQGAIHTFLISYESARPGGERNARERAQRHFERALELSGGRLAAPLVAMAE